MELGANFPRTAVIRQTFPDTKIPDVSGYLQENFFSHDCTTRIQPGQQVAIVAGSRGWANRVAIIKTLVELVRSREGKPFVVAGMGSHGGGTPEGRINVLKKLGITEESVGAPVISTPDVTVLGTTPSGLKVHTATEVVESDWVIVIGRAKPHTSFSGPVESGFHKMMAIGLGKVQGARTVHAQGSAGMCQAIQEIGRVFCERISILCGILLVENAYGETADMHIVPSTEFEQADQEALIQSRQLMAKLPVDQLDVLIVDQMGKNFSGTGIEPKVIGRMRILGVEEPQAPLIKRVGILDISKESAGNATGVGLADFITEKLQGQINLETTYLNCVTSGNVQRAFIPIVAGNEVQLLDMAISSSGCSAPEKLRFARIQNTRDLDLVELSENLLPECTDPEIAVAPGEMTWNAQGDLLPKWP